MSPASTHPTDQAGTRSKHKTLSVLPGWPTATPTSVRIQRQNWPRRRRSTLCVENEVAFGVFRTGELLQQFGSTVEAGANLTPLAKPGTVISDLARPGLGHPNAPSKGSTDDATGT